MMDAARPRQVLHLDYFHVGASGPLVGDSLDGRDGFRYIMETIDDLSNFVRLESTAIYTTVAMAKHQLRCCKAVGMREIRVSHTATRNKQGDIRVGKGSIFWPGFCRCVFAILSRYV